MKLLLEELQVSSFETSAAYGVRETEPVTDPDTGSEPDTWEDTCIKMCPTDDTCTMLGCDRTA